MIKHFLVVYVKCYHMIFYRFSFFIFLIFKSAQNLSSDHKTNIAKNIGDEDFILLRKQAG